MFERISLKLAELMLGLKREDGQGATEYAMVIGFLVVGLTLGLGLLGGSIGAFLTGIGDALEGLIPA
jgi:Flp pilus assembly pilin Flp